MWDRHKLMIFGVYYQFKYNKNEGQYLTFIFGNILLQA